MSSNETEAKPIEETKSRGTTMTQDENNADPGAKPKRYIPDHKKPDAALTFPEKLMNLMKEADKHNPKTFCIAWLPDGKTFIIRDPEEFTRKVLLKFFKATKFSSFTRKLYRWGFRQVNRGIGPDDPIIFGNEFFQRDKEELMANMRSVTAASTRKQEKSSLQIALAQKAQLEEEGRKKNQALIESLLQQKALGAHPLLAAPAPNALDLATVAAIQQQSFAGAAAPGFGLSVYDILEQRMQRNALLGAIPAVRPPSVLSALTGAAAAQAYQRPPATADILNAAISALRYSP